MHCIYVYRLLYACSYVYCIVLLYTYTPIYVCTGQLSTYHIAQLFYMDGSQNHEKDAFEFLIHDLKHMENFIQEDIHSEQVCCHSMSLYNIFCIICVYPHM